jgi:hypothetical protein
MLDIPLDKTIIYEHLSKHPIDFTNCDKSNYIYIYIRILL